jgi:hypothetical protein
MTQSKPLSPAAQAVLDAYLKAPDNRLSVAAALRAAADQSENLYDPHEGKVSVVRVEKLLAIAAELKGSMKSRRLKSSLVSNDQ